MRRYIKYKMFIARSYVDIIRCHILQCIGCIMFKPELPNITLSGSYNDKFTLCLLKLGYVLSPIILQSETPRTHKHLYSNIDMTLHSLGLTQIVGLTHKQILDYICNNISKYDKIYCYGNCNSKLKMKLT